MLSEGKLETTLFERRLRIALGFQKRGSELFDFVIFDRAEDRVDSFPMEFRRHRARFRILRPYCGRRRFEERGI